MLDAAKVCGWAEYSGASSKSTKYSNEIKRFNTIQRSIGRN